MPCRSFSTSPTQWNLVMGGGLRSCIAGSFNCPCPCMKTSLPSPGCNPRSRSVDVLAPPCSAWPFAKDESGTRSSGQGYAPCSACALCLQAFAFNMELTYHALGPKTTLEKCTVELSMPDEVCTAADLLLFAGGRVGRYPSFPP